MNTCLMRNPLEKSVEVSSENNSHVWIKDDKQSSTINSNYPPGRCLQGCEGLMLGLFSFTVVINDLEVV